MLQAFQNPNSNNKALISKTPFQFPFRWSSALAAAVRRLSVRAVGSWQQAQRLPYVTPAADSTYFASCYEVGKDAP
ncbi:MAG TPA: hypothetical protein VD794_08305 [Flavisolibacter sp.]|nr:hypothetical protein [Flavisolibacter sp.]